MKIIETYSHLNGLEFLIVHKHPLWKEILSAIKAVDAEKCKTKISKEKTMKGKLLYSPKAMNTTFKAFFHGNNWNESRVGYWVKKSEKLIRKTLSMPPEDQKNEIIKSGEEPIYSFNQTDFIKDRIAVEVQFGKYPFVTYDLFVKHLAFYIGDKIDVGVEILPMKSLQSQMSSGVSYYEGELYNVVRQGRGVPAVPLVIVGIKSLKMLFLKGDRSMFDRITFDPSIMGGRACIRGMRIPVTVIIERIAHGATREKLLEEYPDIDSEDIRQSLEYAALLDR